MTLRTKAMCLICSAGLSAEREAKGSPLWDGLDFGVRDVALTPNHMQSGCQEEQSRAALVSTIMRYL